MEVEKEKLKSFLVDLDLLSLEEVEKIDSEAQRKNQKIEDLIVSEGLLRREKIARVKAHILGIPFVSLEDKGADPEALDLISENFARANRVAPLKVRGNSLEVAMTDPGNLEVIEKIKKSTGLSVSPRLTTSEGVERVLKQYQQSLEDEVDRIVKSGDGDKIRVIEEGEGKGEDDGDLEKAAKELPVIKIVDIIIKHAILERTSDIHIEPQDDELVVRYRIDGILWDKMKLPIKIYPGVVARIKVLSDLKLDQHRLPQDGRFKVENKKYKYSLRVSILPVSGGEKIVMRLLPEKNDSMELNEIGLQGVSLDRIKKTIKKRSGMILVTGPTGSGKTTTLYSVLGKLNTPRVNISTIEDPIEYQVDRINQTQVAPEIGFTFASGLRSLVRQDPDILMVGEIRDGETAKLATNAALTGHLVLSTLHTTSAAGAASRLIDMGVEPFLVSSTVNIVIAQRLLRVLDDSSKEGYHLDKSQLSALEKHCDLDRIESILKKRDIIESGQRLNDVEFYKPKETEESPEGYKGRVAAFEVLEVSDAIKKMIGDQSDADTIKEKAKQEGMVTMLEDGIVKAAQGITSIEEVLRVLTE